MSNTVTLLRLLVVYVGRSVDPVNEKFVVEMGIMSQVELLVNL